MSMGGIYQAATEMSVVEVDVMKKGEKKANIIF